MHQIAYAGAMHLLDPLLKAGGRTDTFGRGEALAFAARCGRSVILRQLVGRGAHPDTDVYRGTPLIWAAAHGRADAVQTLLELGADPNARGSFGGETHGKDVTPLHLAGASGDEPTVRLLLDAGAYRTVLEGHGYGTPDGWAAHDGHQAIANLIRASA